MIDVAGEELAAGDHQGGSKSAPRMSDRQSDFTVSKTETFQEDPMELIEGATA